MKLLFVPKTDGDFTNIQWDSSRFFETELDKKIFVFLMDSGVNNLKPSEFAIKGSTADP